MSFPKLFVFVFMFLLMVRWGLTTPHFPQWKPSTAARIQFTFSDRALPIALSKLINTHMQKLRKRSLHSAISEIERILILCNHSKNCVSVVATRAFFSNDSTKRNLARTASRISMEASYLPKKNSFSYCSA